MLNTNTQSYFFLLLKLFVSVAYVYAFIKQLRKRLQVIIFWKCYFISYFLKQNPECMAAGFLCFWTTLQPAQVECELENGEPSIITNRSFCFGSCHYITVNKSRLRWPSEIEGFVLLEFTPWRLTGGFIPHSLLQQNSLIIMQFDEIQVLKTNSLFYNN